MDNHLPLLIDAAKLALMAIADNAIDKKVSSGEGCGIAEIAHLFNRTKDTGMGMDERMKEAHGKLQEALLLFMDVENDPL